MAERKKTFVSLTSLGVAASWISGFTMCAAMSLPKPLSDYFTLISVVSAFAFIWDAKIPVFGKYDTKGALHRLIKDD